MFILVLFERSLHSAQASGQSLIKTDDVTSGRKEIVFGCKSDTAVLTFTFCFLSSPPFSLFLPHFFSLAGHLVGFIWVGMVLGKTFRILGLNEGKGTCRWVVEQDFH